MTVYYIHYTYTNLKIVLLLVMVWYKKCWYHTWISFKCDSSLSEWSKLLPVAFISWGIFKQASNECNETVSAEWMSQESTSVQVELVRVLSAGCITYT